MKISIKRAHRLKKIATIASVSLATTLCIIKTFAALWTGSLSVLSSMIDSLSDIFASSITFIAVKFSSAPPSSTHRYGYGKAEALSALIQSAFIAGSGLFVMYDGFSRILYPRPLESTNIGIVIMLISLMATLGLIVFQKYVCSQTKSQAIAADSAHYTIDVMSNSSVILTLLVVKYFHISWFDTLTAFIIALYLLINAYKLAKEAINLLLDRELDNEIRENILKIVTKHKFVLGLHDLRTRDLGGPYLFEFHLELDGNLTLKQAHKYTDIIEEDLVKEYPNTQVMIHQDPHGILEDRLDNQLKD